MTKPIVVFHNFVNVPKNPSLNVAKVVVYSEINTKHIQVWAACTKLNVKSVGASRDRQALIKLYLPTTSLSGPGSIVDIATGYGLNGPWIETRWQAGFFSPVQTPVLGPTQPPIQWVPGLSRG
jgi:hypothetical protein